MYATATPSNPGWLLLLEPRAVQGSTICRCRHPDDEGVMQLRTRERRRREKRGREMTEREATKKKDT
jgi:hypothetical protein